MSLFGKQFTYSINSISHNNDVVLMHISSKCFYTEKWPNGTVYLEIPTKAESCIEILSNSLLSFYGCRVFRPFLLNERIILRMENFFIS